MSAAATPPAIERRDLATRPTDLPGLRAALEAHVAARPLRPEGYDPKTDEGWTYYRALCDWSDTRRRLEHEIQKLTIPKTQPLDRHPKPVPRAYLQAPARFRQ